MSTPTLGRYRIVKELGRGAMGRVFLAHDPRIDRQVAIKTVQILQGLPDEQREQAARRFLEEARAAGALSHPGIVTVFDADVAESVPFIAMEYLEGVTLDHFSRPDNLLPLEVVVELIASAAEALDYAHRKRIVHRDIKPANLMRVGERAVKIMDFGLARAGEERAACDKAIFGTPSFMSPEQIRGEPLDGRSDLFSLAAVLYQLLTGEKAFSGDSVSSVIYRVVNEEPRDASVVSRRIPVTLAGFLKKALAKDRTRRFPTGGAFAEALREAAERAGDMAVAAPAGESSTTSPGIGPLPTTEDALPPAPARRRARKRRRAGAALGWVAATILIAAGAFAAWWYREPLMELVQPTPPEVWLEARVRTDPPGLPVALDGVPLESSTVRFNAAGPFGELTVTQGCRTTSHTLDPADGGGEIVLVPDPTDAEITLDPPQAGAAVRLNGERVGQTPVQLQLDLCRENRVELSADGFRDAGITLAAGATPLETRTALASLRLEPIPRGYLELPAPPFAVTFYVDGGRVDPKGGKIELFEGDHALRMVNTKLWVDVTQQLAIRGGESVRPELRLPPLSTLVVQAYPANCKVYLRRSSGGAWQFLDETPMTRRIAAGSYQVKVEFKPTGEERLREVELRAGENPPVRVSFAGGAS